MNLTEVVKPITYLKNHAAEVVRDAAESGQLFVVTQNGEAKAVVMRTSHHTASSTKPKRSGAPRGLSPGHRAMGKPSFRVLWTETAVHDWEDVLLERLVRT